MAIKRPKGGEAEGGAPKKGDASRLARKAAGRWLSAQREAAGLTQAEIAERVGLRYYTFVSQVEGGYGRVPSEHFESWAKALGHDPQAFAKMLLSFYDPDVFRLLFPGEARSASAG
ncbi:helix-turn-helix domain-containing protein [Caulobacter sp. NIBR2454]|uniref:helix-turn-helix domain-containing protein n=1 Tax=Caulobacter sp. NIBR2454 TaxID=3015996 RepID=UPI0022B60EC9|nr:helix-turn-helix transcriptional regulator [Caulobacter sp. NIBR2454]